MLQSVNELRGYAIEAADGRIGAVKDVYFDDERHTVRYLIVDTGPWLTGRRVLIPPPGVVRVNHAEKTVRVWPTRQQIEDSPGIEEDQPVSRQQEASLYRYWGYPLYWTGPYLWGVGAFPELGAGAARPPVMPLEPVDAPPASDADQVRGDQHLRSAREVIGYHVEATDGSLGHVEDLMIDDADWSLREIVIDTRNWWPGKHVRVPADALGGIRWEDRTIAVRLSRHEIESRPEVPA